MKFHTMDTPNVYIKVIENGYLLSLDTPKPDGKWEEKEIFCADLEEALERTRKFLSTQEPLKGEGGVI